MVEFGAAREAEGACGVAGVMEARMARCRRVARACVHREAEGIVGCRAEAFAAGGRWCGRSLGRRAGGVWVGMGGGVRHGACRVRRCVASAGMGVEGVAWGMVGGEKVAKGRSVEGRVGVRRSRVGGRGKRGGRFAVGRNAVSVACRGERAWSEQ